MLGVVFLILKIIGIVLLILLGLVILILAIPVGVRGEIARRHPALYAKVGPVELKVYPFPQKKERPGKKMEKAEPPSQGTNKGEPPKTGEKKEEKTSFDPQNKEKRGELPPSLQLPSVKREEIKKPPETGEKPKDEFPTLFKEKPAEPKPEKELGVGELPWDLIRRLLGMAGPILRKVLGALRIYDLELVLPIHCREAADTAITYGRVSALIYGTLALLQNLCHLEAKRIRLEPDFTGEQGEIEYFSCKITTHLFIIVVIALWVLFRLKWPKED